MSIVHVPSRAHEFRNLILQKFILRHLLNDDFPKQLMSGFRLISQVQIDFLS